MELTGERGLLTAMVRQVLQTGLEVELEDHLGYERYDPAGRNSGNSRNGSYAKTVTTEIGDVEVLAGVAGTRSWLRFVAPVLLALALATLCFAVARPRVTIETPSRFEAGDNW